MRFRSLFGQLAIALFAVLVATASTPLRAQGVGKQLIDWLIDEMKRRRWSRLYWSTRETNYRARALYDKYTPHSGFLRYVILNPEA